MPSARSASAAARPARPARAPAARPGPRRAPRRATSSTRRRIRWDRVGRVGLLVTFVAVLGLYAQHTLSYFSTRTQADQQQSLVSQLTRDNRSLVRQQAALNDPAVIVRDARALGMVRPGERAYAITGLPGN
ncbi:MAG TPA: septum formation initiator family protein [Solirubrobacteraceae bacterium]|jgi:cell division protein FtsB